MIKQGEKYLITTHEWFLCPDGEEYRGVWGICEIINSEDAFGFTPMRPSTNWFLKIGNEDNHVIVAGCHIHYAVKCSNKPVAKPGTYIHDVTKNELVCSKIYFTE